MKLNTKQKHPILQSSQKLVVLFLRVSCILVQEYSNPYSNCKGPGMSSLPQESILQSEHRAPCPKPILGFNLGLDTG